MPAMPSFTQPAVFVNHGGGPLPLLGQQPSIAKALRSYASTLDRKPKAIVLIDAHWEADAVTVSTAKQHKELIFDYGGFPPESYRYSYQPPGEEAVARRIVELLSAAKIPVKTDSRRGLDHGAFVPLMLMFPEAEIPVVPLSLRHGQDAGFHLQLGQALAPLRDENVLLVGSGLTFHNMAAFFSRGAARERGYAHAKAFDGWLRAALADPDSSAAEHLMPLFVCAGAGEGAPPSRVEGLTTYVGGDASGFDARGEPKSFVASQFEWR